MELILRAIVLIAVIATIDGATKCSDQQTASVAECYRNFISAYGFETENLLPEYWTFHNSRNTWLVDGLGKQPQIKKIGAALTDCMKPYMGCVDADIYSDKFNQTADNAAKYLSDLAVTAYQSSDRGYNLLLKHKYCMDKCKTAMPAQGTKFDTCKKTFKDNAKDVGSCNAFILCVHDVYATCCGPEGGEYECGANRADVAISYTECAGMNQCIMA